MTNRLRLQIVLLALSLSLIVILGGCSGSQPNPNLNLGGIDIGAVFDGMMARVPNALNGINSMDSIDKAHQELTAVSLDLDDLIFNSKKMSDAGRLDLAAMAMNARPEIERLTQMVNESPVFQEKLGGTMEEIGSKLKQLM